jgi:hypothetical protein
MKFFFAQIGCSIYHLDLFSEENLNQWSEIWNSACGTCYFRNGFGALFQNRHTSPNLKSVWSYFPHSTWYNGNSKNSHQIMCTEWCRSTWYQSQILEQIQDLKSFFLYLVRIMWYSQYTHMTKNSHKINPTNHTIWSGTRTYFSRRIQIWTQKFEIPSVAQDMAIFVF